MWENIVEPGRPKITVWRMRIACSIPKGTNSHSDYVILIAFLRQEWLREFSLMSRYMCNVRLVYSEF